MSCWTSQIELSISPVAIGVVVCWRMSRNASWFSAGVGSSIQNSRQSSTSLPNRAASIGVSRWCTSCSRWKSNPNRSRTARREPGAKFR